MCGALVPGPRLPFSEVASPVCLARASLVAGLWVPASRGLLPVVLRPLPPAALPRLQVCHSAGVKCALVLEQLALDNLWIIANSR